jgi:type 1 glutamine amidotransferase
MNSKGIVNMKNMRCVIVALGAMIGSQLAAPQTPGRGGFSLPSVSVRPPDQGQFRTTAMTALGWRLGVRTDAFGPVTFWEAVAKADAAGLAAVEGVSTQKVSPDIGKMLDYNLTPEELTKVKNRLDELRLRMPAYYVAAIPADESSRRKVFAFAHELGADMIISPAGPESFAELDKLANEIGINVAVAAPNPKAAMGTLEGLSKRIGLSINPGALGPLKDRALSVNLRAANNSSNVSPFLVELSRLQPPNVQPDWPPAVDGGAKRSEVKPLLFTLDPTGSADAVASLSQAASAYDKQVRPAIAWRIDTLSRITPISRPDNLPAEQKQKIDAAVPRQALVKPKKARKLLVLDLCVNGGYYHASIPDGNLAIELIGKYTGAYQPTFSNDLDNLRYPKIKQYDAVFLNSVEGELFIGEDVINSLIRYVREGGGLAGLHATTFASTDVPEFGELIGAQTGAHKYNGEQGTLRVDDPASPLTKQFDGRSFDFFDEFYHFLPTGPYSRQKLHVLLSLDPAKTELSANRYTTRPDNDYGTVWIRSYGKGRVFNCALGHKPQFYETPNMERLLLAATQFVLGDLEADTTPSARLALKK